MPRGRDKQADPSMMIGNSLAPTMEQIEEEALCAAMDEALEAMLATLNHNRELVQVVFPDDVGEEDVESAIELCGQSLDAMVGFTINTHAALALLGHTSNRPCLPWRSAGDRWAGLGLETLPKE